jgi:DNA polymerase III sliding clamp (beta) subunit (PCNA family)
MKTSKALNKAELKQFIGILQALVNNVSRDIARVSLIHVEATFDEGKLKLSSSDGHKMFQVEFPATFFEASECKPGSIRTDDLQLKIAELKLIKLAKGETRHVELPAIDTLSPSSLISDVYATTRTKHSTTQESYARVDAKLLAEVCQSLVLACNSKQTRTMLLTAESGRTPIGFEIARTDNALDVTLRALLAPVR